MRAGEIIRRRNALGRNKGAIGTTAHCNILRRNAQLTHSLKNMVNANTVIFVQSVGNIAVNIDNLQLYPSLRIFSLNIIYSVCNKFFARFVHYFAMVTNFEV